MRTSNRNENPKDVAKEYKAYYKVPHYALILIHDGEYWGHVYLWLVGDVCYFMGIRKRVDWRLLAEPLRDVSGMMLEAAKEFAQRSGAKILAVPSPLPSMTSKLYDLGFRLTFDYDEEHDGTLATGIESDYIIDLNKLTTGWEDRIAVTVLS